MYVLFLDDERVPYSIDGDIDAYNYTNNPDYINLDWVVVRNYDEFVNYIEKNGLPRLVSFDHDLSDFNKEIEMTGYDCCKWLCDYCIDNNLKFPKYLIHTPNIIGSRNITKYIENFKNFYE